MLEKVTAIETEMIVSRHRSTELRIAQSVLVALAKEMGDNHGGINRVEEECQTLLAQMIKLIA